MKNDDDFGFKNLIVWQKSIVFADRIMNITEEIGAKRKNYRLLDQIEDSASSVPSNIAEGKGRYSKKEFVHFLHIARASLFETISRLQLFRLRNWVSESQQIEIENEGKIIAKMLNMLINSIRK